MLFFNLCPIKNASPQKLTQNPNYVILKTRVFFSQKKADVWKVEKINEAKCGVSGPQKAPLHSASFKITLWWLMTGQQRGGNIYKSIENNSQIPQSVIFGKVEHCLTHGLIPGGYRAPKIWQFKNIKLMRKREPNFLR